MVHPARLQKNEKPPCIHSRARADRRCVGYTDAEGAPHSCGKPTSSHELEGSVTQRVQCPDCGQYLSVLSRRAQCHVCWTKEQAFKMGKEEFESKPSTSL